MRPTVDDIRRTVALPMARRGVVRAGVFGSFARGDATESSDIDFLVEFEQGRTLLDLSGLRLDLCEAFGRGRRGDARLASSAVARSGPS
jgi:uncharacterized protein